MSDDVRFRVIAAGFSGDEPTVRAHLDHPDPLVRASALRALARLGSLTATDLVARLEDPDKEVRRTVAELSTEHCDVPVHRLIDDEDLFVAEMAAWCLGERQTVSDEDLTCLIQNTTTHVEQVVREACAAALGSLGDPRGLPAILAACRDKPAVRRRAILALAPFDGDEVQQTLESALQDRDWQVRQNAEILLHPRD
jgi:HEAT repeat protein